MDPELENPVTHRPASESVESPKRQSPPSRLGDLKSHLSRSRFWFVWVWAFVLSTSLGAVDASWRWIQGQAAERPLLLLPRDSHEESARIELIAELVGHAEIESGKWLSPMDLATQTSQIIAGAFSSEYRDELFSEEANWLPWMVELHFVNPIRNQESMAKRLRFLHEDQRWRLVLWDGRKFQHDAKLLDRLARIINPAWLLVLFGGIAGLAFGGRSDLPWFVESALNFGVVASLAAFLGLLAASAELRVDGRAWGVALGAAFILAGLVAPMIKGRQRT